MSDNIVDDWRTMTVQDIAASDIRSIAIGPFGSTLKAELYSSTGIPVVRGQDIQDGRPLAVENAVFVPESVAARFPACIVRHDDLIFPHRGAIGRVGIVDDGCEFLLSSSMMKLTCNQKIVDPDFIFYYFRGPGRSELLARASTVGTPGIAQPLNSLRGIPVSIPPLGMQRAIADVLRALDDKIAADDRARQTAADLARALFSCAAAHETKESIHKIAELVTRGIAPKYVESDGVLVVNQKCIRDKRVTLASSRITDMSAIRERKMLQRDDVLVNSTGMGTLGRAARWVHSVRATADSHVTIIRFNPALVDPVCAGFGVVQIERQIEGLAEGSTGQTELRRELLSGLEISVPDRETQGQVSAKLSALDELNLRLENETTALAATRDELLPLLMAGKVRVREAEKVVEEVV